MPDAMPRLRAVSNDNGALKGQTRPASKTEKRTPSDIEAYIQRYPSKAHLGKFMSGLMDNPDLAQEEVRASIARGISSQFERSQVNPFVAFEDLASIGYPLPEPEKAAIVINGSYKLIEQGMLFTVACAVNSINLSESQMGEIRMKVIEKLNKTAVTAETEGISPVSTNEKLFVFSFLPEQTGKLGQLGYIKKVFNISDGDIRFPKPGS